MNMMKKTAYIFVCAFAALLSTQWLKLEWIGRAAAGVTWTKNLKFAICGVEARNILAVGTKTTLARTRLETQ